MIIQITGVTSGLTPFDVYLCDTGYTSCFLISGSCIIPPTIVINTNLYFPNQNEVGIKLIDSNGCITTENKVCVPVPTPTSTPTPTPTISPTPTPTVSPTPTPIPPTATPTPTISPTPTPTPTPTVSPTPTPTPTTPPDVVIASSFDDNSDFYLYSINDNTMQGGYNLSGLTDGGTLANSSNKIWVRPFDGGIDELNYTLNPFSVTYSRSITNPFSESTRQGFEAKDTNTLICTHYQTGTSLNYVYNIDISGSAATYTQLFQLQGSLSGDPAIQDIVLSTTGDLIILGSDGTNYYIQQYNYSSGATLDIEIDITTGVTTPTGIIGSSGSIYIIDSNGETYSIEVNSPYLVSSYQTTPGPNVFYTTQNIGSLTVSFN